MERKLKMGWTAYLIIGIVFTVIGAIFTALGVAFALVIEDLGFFFFLSFGGIGIVFLVMGIIFLVSQAVKKQTAKRLVQEGNYILAEIMDVYMDYNIHVNNQCPYIVRCRYEDGSGVIHTFKSRGIFFNPEGLFKDQFIRVYVDRDDFRKYYVDIDSVLPEVRNH